MASLVPRLPNTCSTLRTLALLKPGLLFTLAKLTTSFAPAPRSKTAPPCRLSTLTFSFIALVWPLTVKSLPPDSNIEKSPSFPARFSTFVPKPRLMVWLTMLASLKNVTVSLALPNAFRSLRHCAR